MEGKQPESSDKLSGTDVVAVTFFGCLSVGLMAVIPILTFLAGVLTFARGLYFWGVFIMALGALALIGPYYAASRTVKGVEKAAGKEADG